MKKIFEKTIILSLITATMTYASNKNNINPIDDRSNLAMKEIAYVNMSTEELQKEVEKRSVSGDLSFDMGLELIRRWTNS